MGPSCPENESLVPPSGLPHSDLARARLRVGGGKDKGPDDPKDRHRGGRVPGTTAPLLDLIWTRQVYLSSPAGRVKHPSNDGYCMTHHYHP